MDGSRRASLLLGIGMEKSGGRKRWEGERCQVYYCTIAYIMFWAIRSRTMRGKRCAMHCYY